MAGPNKSDTERDIELDNESDADEDMESVEGSSSSPEEDENSDKESSSSGSSPDSDDESMSSSDSEQSDCLSDVWSDGEAKADADPVPEAQEAQLRIDFDNLLLQIVDGMDPDVKLDVISNLTKLCENPILSRYKMQYIGDYNWKEAVEKAKYDKVANNGQLYYAINKIIAQLFLDLEEHQMAINHFLQALSIHPDYADIWWECALSSAKIANWNFSRFAISMAGTSLKTVKLLAIVQFYTDQFEECLQSLCTILDYDAVVDTASRKFAMVLKDEIANLGEPFKRMVESVFGNDDVNMPKWKFVDVAKDMRSVIKESINSFNQSFQHTGLEPKVQYAPVEVEISRKMKIEDFGVVLCDLFDRIEAFSDIFLQKVKFVFSDDPTENHSDQPVQSEVDQEIAACLNEVLDVVCCTEDLLFQVSEDKLEPLKPIPVRQKPQKPKPKPKRGNSSLALYQRRSTRYIEQEDNTDDEYTLDERILEALDISQKLAEKRSSKYELRKTKRSGDEGGGIHLHSYEPPDPEAVEAFLGAFIVDSHQEYVVEPLLERFLTFLSSGEFVITGQLKDAFIGAYMRWIVFDREAKAFMGIHLAAAELDCKRAVALCCKAFAETSSTYCNNIRFKWMMLDRSDFDVAKKESVLLNIEEVLAFCEKNSKRSEYIYSFTPEKHSITAKLAAAKRIDMLRKCQLEQLDALIEESRHEDIVTLLESHYNWNDGEIEDVMRNSMTLINSYAKLGNKDKVVELTIRIIQAFLKGVFTDDDRVADLLNSLVVDSTIDDVLLHDLAYYLYLLRETNKFIRLPMYWIRLYEAAKVMEGGISLEIVKRHMKRYEEEEFEETLPTRAFSVLQIAHEKLGEVSCCGLDKGAFLVYYLTELNKIASEESIRELFFSRHSEKSFHDVAATFGDEFNQLLFCFLAHTGKKTKVVCEDHHARCDTVPSWNEAVLIVPILFREKLHLFDDKLKVPQDSIDILLKNFAFIWEEQDKKSEELFQEFLEHGVLNDWPRAPADDPGRDSTRSTIFYALALYYYQTISPIKAAEFAKRFLVSASADPDWVASAWAILAHMCSARLLDEKDDLELLRDAEKCLFAFEMGFRANNEIAITHFELANTAYQLRTRIARHVPTMGRTLKRAKAEQLMHRLLLISRKHIDRANELNNAEQEPEQDIEWLVCYFRGKIAEKLEEPAEKILYYYYQCAKILERQGYQYCPKISKKKQENLEPVEIHYRVYSYIWKRLSNADEVPDLYDMNLMTVYAEHFENHGVTRRFLACSDSDEAFEQEPDIRAVLNELTYNASLRRSERMDPEIYDSVSDMVERVHLRERCLSLCESNFALVVSRYPFHYKAHYRIAEMEQQQGHYKKAISHLFQKVFKKRNPYVSVFENCIPIHRRDVERSGSFEFHMDRLMELSLYCCFKENDIEKMCSLLYSLGLAAKTPGVLNEYKRKERIGLARSLIVTLVKRNDRNVLRLTNREKETFLKTAMFFSEKAKANCDELTHKVFVNIVKHISEAIKAHRDQAVNRMKQQAYARKLVHHQQQQQHLPHPRHNLFTGAGDQRAQEPHLMLLASLYNRIRAPMDQQAAQILANPPEGMSTFDHLTSLLKRSAEAQSSDAPPNKISKQQ